MVAECTLFIKGHISSNAIQKRSSQPEAPGFVHGLEKGSERFDIVYFRGVVVGRDLLGGWHYITHRETILKPE